MEVNYRSVELSQSYHVSPGTYKQATTNAAKALNLKKNPVANIKRDSFSRKLNLVSCTLLK